MTTTTHTVSTATILHMRMTTVQATITTMTTT
jgi:hypothetical protein